jgi:hypothetical protein
VPLDGFRLNINTAYGVKSNKINVFISLCSLCMLLHKGVGSAFHFQSAGVYTVGDRDLEFKLTPH